MTLATLVNIGSLISSVAVLVSLVYLNRQIRQGALNQRSKMDRGRSQQVGDWLQYIAQPDTAALILRGHAGDPSLSAVECHRYLWSMYPLFLHFEDSYFQHRDGMLGEGQYASILGHLRSQCGAPGFRSLWLHIRERFPRDFVTFVDEVMREAPVGGAEIAQWTAAWKTRAAAEASRTRTPETRESSPGVP
ncbi:hypothetical protein [Dokdonella soli]|uniref:DUF4760 domain-containing protein n=1 Tax=Dokdonella soli TaxID=529810 RepID=A0ABP3TP95_9GAMM